jgi:outer membrane protein OmpA-like peptidoglycan-associated protein
MPIVETYTKVILPEITVHGNARYTSYGLQNDVLFDKWKANIKSSAEAKLKQISESI